MVYCGLPGLQPQRCVWSPQKTQQAEGSSWSEMSPQKPQIWAQDMGILGTGLEVSGKDSLA